MQKTETLSSDLGKVTIISEYSREPKYIKQEPKVLDDGIYVPVHPYVEEGVESGYQMIMSREIFVEAYNKYIKDA